ncbi:hypothetical protein BC938DRAFT_475032, partial [Jimgerdemannia flammicorona]
MLVGTNITRKDVIGTCVVIASVIWIVVFGGMTNGQDRKYHVLALVKYGGLKVSRNSPLFVLLLLYSPAENNLSLDGLKLLYLHPLFIVYFSALNIITFGGLIFGIYAAWVLADDQRKNRDKLFRDMELKRMKKAVGMSMSIVGGLMASETLLLAKS